MLPFTMPARVMPIFDTPWVSRMPRCPLLCVYRTMCLIEGNLDIRGGMFLTPNFVSQVRLCRSMTKQLRCLPAAVAAIQALAHNAPEESIDAQVCSLLAAFASEELPNWTAVAGADSVEQVVEALRRAVSRGDFTGMLAWMRLLDTLMGDDRIVRQTVQENCAHVLLLVLAATGLPGHAKTDTKNVLGYLQCSICKLLDRMVDAGHTEAVLVAGGVEGLAGLLKRSQENDVREQALEALASLAERDTEDSMYMQARGGMRDLSGAFLMPDINWYVFEGLCLTLLLLAKMPPYQALLQQDAVLLAALENRLLEWDATWGWRYSKTQCRKLIAVCVHRPARRSHGIKRQRELTVQEISHFM